MGGLLWFLSALLIELANNGIYSQTLSAATFTYVLPCTIYHWVGVIWNPFFLLIVSPIVQKLDSAIYSRSPRISQIRMRHNRHCQKRNVFIQGGNCLKVSLMCTADFAFNLNYILSFCFMCLFLLLIYNSQSTKYTLLKCTLLCFLYPQVCVNPTFRTFPLFPKTHIYSETLLFIPSAHSWKNPNMLSVCMDLTILDISSQWDIIYGRLLFTLSI